MCPGSGSRFLSQIVIFISILILIVISAIYVMRSSDTLENKNSYASPVCGFIGIGKINAKLDRVDQTTNILKSAGLEVLEVELVSQQSSKYLQRQWKLLIPIHMRFNLGEEVDVWCIEHRTHEFFNSGTTVIITPHNTPPK